MKKYILVLIVFVAYSCEYIDDCKSNLVNQSTKKLSLKVYKDGKEQLDLNRTVNVQETKEVLQSDIYRAYAHLLSDTDSLEIIYEDRSKAVHYGFNLLRGTNPKAIKFDNARNLLNHRNWQETVLETKSDIRKGIKKRVFTYTFTEQDYLEAKK